MKIRKTAALILSVLLFINSLPVFAGAIETEYKAVPRRLSPLLYDSPGDMQTSLEELESKTDTAAFRNIILSAIKKCTPSVDLSSLRIPEELIMNVGEFIWYHMPEAFNVDGFDYTLIYISGKAYLGTVSFVYRDFADTEAEYTACFSGFRAAADKLLEGIENNSALTDMEKALLLHDRLALWNEYDFTSSSVIKHTAYGAFVKRASVCQGYAMAYMYLLQRVGIENCYCASSALNHGWNIVIIDDIPYHVDVTWDDCRWSKYGRGAAGRVAHNNFLLSTDGIRASGHSASDFDASPQDTRYDNYFWQKSETAFQLVNNELYYIDYSAEKLMRMSDKKEIADVKSRWYAENGGVWNKNYACLAAVEDKLLYSLADGVYALSPETGKTEKIYTPQLEKYYSVFGFMYEDGFIICDINNTPNDDINLSVNKSAYSYQAPVISAVEIVSPAEKTVYYIGDSLDTEGLKLKLSYSDGTYRTVTSGFSVSGFSSEKAGSVKVNVSCGGFSVSFNVSVKTPSVELSHSDITMNQGDTKSLSAVTSPVGLSVSWSSSDLRRVTVNSGKLTAAGKGSAVITAKITYNGITYTDTCSVNVFCDHKNTENTPATSSDCTLEGFTAGVRCKDCEKYISGHEILPLNNNAHRWDGGKITAEATCSKNGVITYTCQNNKAHTYTESTEPDKNNHKEIKTVPAKEPTVTEAGYTEGIYCSGCKTYISGHEEIPKKESVFTDSENACLQGEYIMFISSSSVSLTAGDILEKATSGSVIKTAEGKAADNAVTACTGMTLTLPDGRSLTLVCPGDVNCDGKITAADARSVLRASVGLEKIEEGSARYKAANVNADTLAASDARLILRASVGLEDPKQWLKA